MSTKDMLPADIRIALRQRGPDYQASCEKCGFFISGFGKQQTQQIARRNHIRCDGTVRFQRAQSEPMRRMMSAK